MKRIALFIATAVVATACKFNTSSNQAQPQTQPKDPVGMERFEPTDEELYAACADLKGIGQYVIGKTTYKSILKDKEFRENISSYSRDGNFYNGHWGYDFWKDKLRGSGIYDNMEESHYIEKRMKGKLRQIPCSYSYKMGELKFDHFDMAFLNDTLVAIWFYPDDKDVDSVVNHFKEKYGNGRGKEYKNSSTYGDTYINRVDIEHVWENETVAMKYIKDEYFKMTKGNPSYSNFKTSMFIYSKSRYPVFEQMLLGCIDQQLADIEQSKQKSISTL